MAKWKALSSVLIFCIGIGSPAAAAPSTFQPRIAGASMSCLSWTGKPVQVVSNYNLQTLGRASSDRDGSPIIEINFAQLNAFSPVVQKWWFAHECAHHQLPPQLNSEKRADCMAGKQLKKLAGSEISSVAASIQREFALLPASDRGHLAGPERAQHVLKCAGFTLQA